jgi:hypothetical protein
MDIYCHEEINKHVWLLAFLSIRRKKSAQIRLKILPLAVHNL